MSDLCKAVQQQITQITEKKPPVSTYVPKITSSIPKSEFIITNKINDKQSKFDENEKENAKMEKGNNDVDNRVASISDSEDEIFVQNGSNGSGGGDAHAVPPKPLPRASRTGSICDATEENFSSAITTTTSATTTPTATTPRPVARPRTTNYTPVVTSVNPNAPISGGYKVLASFIHSMLFVRMFVTYHDFYLY